MVFCILELRSHFGSRCQNLEADVCNPVFWDSPSPTSNSIFPAMSQRGWNATSNSNYTSSSHSPWVRNYKDQEERGGKDNGYNKHRDSDPRHRNRNQRSRTRRPRAYVVCLGCGNWDWQSYWKPCCDCGLHWGDQPDKDPAGLDSIDNGKSKLDKENAAPKEISPEQRKQFETMVAEMSKMLGKDLSKVLANQLPAIQSPKGEKQIEVERWGALRDARRKVDKCTTNLHKAEAQLAKKKAELAEATESVDNLRMETENATATRDSAMRSFVGLYGEGEKERAEEEAGIRPKRQRTGAGGFDDDDFDLMADSQGQERQEIHQEQQEEPGTASGSRRGLAADRSRSPTRTPADQMATGVCG